jgi:hypothetical protein
MLNLPPKPTHIKISNTGKVIGQDLRTGQKIKQGLWKILEWQDKFPDFVYVSRAGLVSDNPCFEGYPSSWGKYKLIP